MTLPRSTMATASQVRSTSSSRCDDSTTVRPSATRDRIMSRMSSMPAGSRPFIGSSRISSCGVAEEAGGHAQTLAHAHGVLGHLVVGPMEDADALERRLDAALGRRLTRRGEDLQVLAAGQVAVEAGLVDDRPDAGQGRVTVPGDAVAEQEHGAGVGVGQAQQHPDQRRLAGAVRAEVSEGAAAGNEELDVVHGDVVAEPLGQPVGLDGPLAVAGRRGRRVRQCCGAHTVTFTLSCRRPRPGLTYTRYSYR